MSLEEFGGWDAWLNSIQLGEQGEVSAEAVVKVREDMQKSAQMRGQIAQAGKQNAQFAQLLILLLQHITDEKLIGHVFRQLTESHFSIPAIFAQFLPFIVDHVQLQVTAGPFADLLPKAQQMDRSLEWLVGWMKWVYATFPQLAGQQTDQKASLVLDLAQVYEFTRLESLDEQQRKDLRELVKREVA